MAARPASSWAGVIRGGGAKLKSGGAKGLNGSGRCVAGAVAAVVAGCGRGWYL